MIPKVSKWARDNFWVSLLRICADIVLYVFKCFLESHLK